MASEIKSSSLSSTEKRRIAKKEDLKHVFEELRDCKPDENSHKIVHVVAKKVTVEIFAMSTDELLNFTWREKDSSLHPVTASEVCKIIMVLNYERHLKEMG